MKRIAVAVSLMMLLFAVAHPAQQKNGIEGVWQAISQKVDGKESLTSGSDLKYITAKHWIWIYQDKTKSMAPIETKKGETLASILSSANAFGAGAGTYKLVGNKYTETIQYFGDPSYIGLSLDFTVKVEGDRLYQSGKYPMLEGGKKVKDVQLDEVYKRIE
jgi:hypothetical protein